MNQVNNLYRVFLLRLWREHDGNVSAPTPLRIVLEDPGSGQRTTFPSLEALLRYLQGQVQSDDVDQNKEADT